MDVNNLVKSVSEFTGVSAERAHKLLEESNWNVPEAVSRFFNEVEVAHANPRPVPQPTRIERIPVSRGIFAAFILSIKSCLGWAAYSCWNACKLFLFGSSAKSGSGNLHGSLPLDVSFSGSFAAASAESRKRDERKVLCVYLHDSRCIDFSAQTSLICECIAETEFLFWAGDCQYQDCAALARAFGVRATPALVLVSSINSTEFKLVGACTGTAFSRENIQTVFFKAQTFQDGLMAEDLTRKADRELRAGQDLEYEQALARDRTMSETNALKMSIESEKRRIAKEAQCEKERLVSLMKNTGGTGACIVVKLPNGTRIERKFDTVDPVSKLYEWVFCCGILHAETCAEFGKKIATKNSFELATTFPSKRLTEQELTLQQAGLVPNAVLVFITTDDNDSE